MAHVNEEVLEGFLCPICMQDLTSITQLQAHFEEQHETEDKAVLQSLKGFFNKAKRKLLNEEEDIEGLSRRLQNPFLSTLQTFEQNNPWEWEPPSYIPARSHITIYKRIRSSRVDSFVTETNKLLIRLDKLLSQIPSDPAKRKVHEKDIVPWADDKDVPLCPFCARSFNLARRRHHCRLCGAIMCDDCSQKLPFSFAQKLVSPIHHGNASDFNSKSTENRSTSSQSTIGTLLGGLSGLKRSGSHGSLNSLMSMMDSIGKEQCFKICAHCLARLKARDRQVEQRSSKPLLSIYYEKLMEYRKQLTLFLPQYLKMIDSLSCGETTYNLQDADELRTKILRLSDGISMSAQKIRNLGAIGVALDDQQIQSNADGEKINAGPRQELLQKRIHSSTVGFLKDNVLGLPKLPTASEVHLQRERKRKETDTRLAAQRESARIAEERATLVLRRKKMGEDSPKENSTVSSSSSSSSAYSTPNKKLVDEVSIDAGWLADTTAHNVTETDDPIVQQMNIIRNYIRQARDASKYDEVSLLEANLRELQLEFKSQQRILDS